MFDRLTSDARSIISYASEIGRELGREEFDSSHMLLAIARQDTGIAGRALRHHVDVTDIQQTVLNMNAGRAGWSQQAKLSDEAKDVVLGANHEAELLGAERVGAEHVLLSMIRRQCAGFTVLDEGCEPAKVRQTIVQMISGFDETAKPPVVEAPSIRAESDPRIITITAVQLAKRTEVRTVAYSIQLPAKMRSLQALQTRLEEEIDRLGVKDDDVDVVFAGDTLTISFSVQE